ncbi:hypothetical protein THIOKS13160004 [Thiocapsa sp. KS1]|nr:hypothetical protein THIOKS13160004 [Thiocapsa sp. KS1]
MGLSWGTSPKNERVIAVRSDVLPVCDAILTSWYPNRVRSRAAQALRPITGCGTCLPERARAGRAAPRPRVATRRAARSSPR